MLVAEEITEQIIAGAIEVHRKFGAGLLESAYEACLVHELSLRGLRVQRQVAIPIEYNGVRLDCGYRIDMIVEDTVLVELKAIEKLLPIHEAQLLTYLRISGKRVGLLINFNVKLLVDGIVRRVI